MAAAAAARRAAAAVTPSVCSPTPLLLNPSLSAAAPSLSSATPLLNPSLSAAAPSLSSATPLLLTPSLCAAATATQLAVRYATAEIRHAATPLVLTGADTTTTISYPIARNAAAKIKASLSAGALLQSSCGSASPSNLRHHASTTATRSSCSIRVMGDRINLSAPADMGAAGSLLARRGMATQAATLQRHAFSRVTGMGAAGSLLARRGMANLAGLTPEVQKALQRLEKSSEAEHAKLMKQLEEFELNILANYSMAQISSAEKALTAGQVASRVSAVVLAFGVTTLVIVLESIKEGWKPDFQTEVKPMLHDIVEKIMSELVSDLPELVRNEIKAIDAEKGSR